MLAGSPSAAEYRAAVLDHSVLLSVCGSDDGLLRELCAQLRFSLPNHLAAMRSALDERDAPRLREAVHKMCGMVAAFSNLAGDLASNVEHHAARGQSGLGVARALVAQLESVCQELLRILRDDPTVESLRRGAKLR